MAEKVNIDPLVLANHALEENPVLFSKITVACDISKEEVVDILKEVIVFMSLVSQYGKKLTPSLIVDYAWHELILCTRHYHHLCEKQFGRYIHHHPGGEEKENHKQFVNTIKLYKETFGTPPVKYWGHLAEELPSKSDCGACDAF
ncbi:MAG: hypothetical protein JXQ96_02940 [Cyclobacteriaceae bacterium]